MMQRNSLMMIYFMLPVVTNLLNLTI